MAGIDALKRGREAFRKQVWGNAFACLSTADLEEPLEAEDLERLAITAYMVGKDDASTDAWTRAHHYYQRHQNPPAAARCAFWHACGLFFKGDMAPAMGWVARGQRVLETAEEDCPERGWLLFLSALPIMFQGDPETAYSSFVLAGEIAERFNDSDVLTLSRLGRGQSLIMQQRTAEGVALLDELMVAVVSGEVSPLVAGVAYCAVIDLCQSVFDLRRAREWTAALSRWCDSQPDLVPYRGNCLIHRCEIFQLQGAWSDALNAAQDALANGSRGPRPGTRSDRPTTNWERSSGCAASSRRPSMPIVGPTAQDDNRSRAGHCSGSPSTSPRLRRRRSGARLTQTQEPMSRSRLLPAYVEIMLAADDVTAARKAADELSGDRSSNSTRRYLHAVGASSAGAILLAEGDARAALSRFREAFVAWRELDAPHYAARVRVLIGLACRALGDDGGAEMEFDAARAPSRSWRATQTSTAAKLMAEPRGDRPAAYPAVKVEVLELVASGKTNRAIAGELFLSDKTVARHVSNIFTKLGLSSRSAVTAYAYENGLV